MHHPCPLVCAPAATVPLEAPVGCCATVYDPADLATLLVHDPPRAQRQIARLTPPQRACQALAHAHWCATHTQPCTLEAVLADWQRFVAWHGASSEHPAAPEPPLPITVLAFQITADPRAIARLIAAMTTSYQHVAASEHAQWLTAHGLPRTSAEVLQDWQALVDGAGWSNMGDHPHDQ